MSGPSDFRPIPSVPGGGSTSSDYPVIVSATAPTPPTKGLAWLNSGTGVLSVYNGARWVVMSGLPLASRQGQTIVAGNGPTFPWSAGDLDGARY